MDKYNRTDKQEYFRIQRSIISENSLNREVEEINQWPKIPAITDGAFLNN